VAEALAAEAVVKPKAAEAVVKPKAEEVAKVELHRMCTSTSGDAMKRLGPVHQTVDVQWCKCNCSKRNCHSQRTTPLQATAFDDA